MFGEKGVNKKKWGEGTREAAHRQAGKNKHTQQSKEKTHAYVRTTMYLNIEVPFGLHVNMQTVHVLFRGKSWYELKKEKRNHQKQGGKTNQKTLNQQKKHNKTETKKKRLKSFGDKNKHNPLLRGIGARFSLTVNVQRGRKRETEKHREAKRKGRTYPTDDTHYKRNKEKEEKQTA